MRKTMTCALALSLALLCIGGCTPAGGDPAPGQTTAGVPSPSAVPGAGTINVEPARTPAPTPTPTPAPTPTPEPTPVPVRYWFGTPVEEGDEVDGESWFADAVFVGDSRTEGIQVFSGIREADYFWYRGLSVFKADDENYRVFEVDGEKLNLIEALARKQYGKVYLMIGTNELGYRSSVYEEGLGTLLDMIRAVQPDAVIYLQTLPPVNEAAAQAKGLGSYINNANVNSFNEAIVRQARERRAALLDVASLFRDENGVLPADMAADGVHFRKAGYQLWAEYLRTHTLSLEDYRSGQPAEELWCPLPAPAESEAPAESADPVETDPPVETPPAEDPAPVETAVSANV